MLYSNGLAYPTGAALYMRRGREARHEALTGVRARQTWVAVWQRRVV
jgi:hypothetical protein